MDEHSVVILRTASQEDAIVLAIHHRKMFEEIWNNQNIPFIPEKMKTMETNYRQKLQDDIQSGSCHAWIICQNKQILSSGAVSIFSYVPVPHDPSPCIAFLHSIYTEPEERGKGYAAMITKKAIDFCKQKNIGRLYLFASESGRSVYEKEGFVSVDNTMVKYIL